LVAAAAHEAIEVAEADERVPVNRPLPESTPRAPIFVVAAAVRTLEVPSAAGPPSAGSRDGTASHPNPAEVLRLILATG